MIDPSTATNGPVLVLVPWERWLPCSSTVPTATMIVASISHRTIVSACHALAACVTCVRVATRPGISSTPYHLVANMTINSTSALPALISAPWRSLRRGARSAVSAVGASTIAVTGTSKRHGS